MRLSTNARDCLYLNWAVPMDLAPPLPADLSYETHPLQGDDWVFVTALLFRFVGLRARSLPFLRISYPQLNVRLYVRDRSGAPSVLYLRMVVPLWVLPASRIVGRQQASAGRFVYPSPSSDLGAETWTWRVEGDQAFAATGQVSAPTLGRGPDLGDWSRTVAYFQRRRKGYAMWDDRFRTVDKSRPTPAIWPMEVEVERSEVLSKAFPSLGAEDWRIPHSAWLCPEIPFNFQVGKPRLSALPAASPVAMMRSDC